MHEEKIEDYLNEAYNDLLHSSDDKNNVNISLIKNMPKNRIMNFTLLDYLKYKIFNNSVGLQIKDIKNINLKNEYKKINNKLIAKIYGKFDNVKDLLYIHDNLGDTIQLTNESQVDYDNRDKFFVFINNEWLESSTGFHAQLIRDYLKKIDSKVKINNAIVNSFDDLVSSINDKKIIKKIESMPLIFGNILGKIGFLLSATNISKRQAAQMIKEKFNLEKVYFQQAELHKYTKLASNRIINRILKKDLTTKNYPANPKSILNRNNPDVRFVSLTSPLYGSENSYSAYVNQNVNNEMFQHQILNKPRLIVKNINDFYDKYFENDNFTLKGV